MNRMAIRLPRGCSTNHEKRAKKVVKYVPELEREKSIITSILEFYFKIHKEGSSNGYKLII